MSSLHAWVVAAPAKMKVSPEDILTHRIKSEVISYVLVVTWF